MMLRTNTVTSHLTKVSQFFDELIAIGEQIDDDEMVRVSLNGFSKPWNNFVHVIVIREKLHDWERIWDDFMQEELRLDSRSTSQLHGEDEENVSLATKGQNKFMKGPNDGAKKKGEHKKNMI